VNYHPLPVRHGMTLGELARFFQWREKIKAKLRVIPCKVGSATSWFRRDRHPVVDPSPALRNLSASTLPGMALLEQTNVSVGRGTDLPFGQIGASWVDAKIFRIPECPQARGARFEPVDFTPASTLSPEQFATV